VAPQAGLENVALAGLPTSSRCDAHASQATRSGSAHYGHSDPELPPRVWVPEQLTRLGDEAVAAFGGLDILVNNAGMSKSGAAESFPLQDFDRMLAVNVRGVFVAIQRAIPHLGPGGRIVTTGSIFADRVPRPGGAVYAMTKAALAGLTRGLARELGPRGITVNVIQPGPTATDANPDSGEFADAMRQLTAVGHYGRPEDIASAVAYLVSPETGFITGITWNVDGGFAA